jgi:CRISPR system Cascade subunit CasA
MNLIFEPWIPIHRVNGSHEKIAPWQITDHVGTDKSPIIAIASPRSDLDGALLQFLIGLLQTTCTPPDRMSWRKWRKEPPPVKELNDHFIPYKEAFNLFGSKGPIFMQERLIDSGKGKPHPVSYLLIGSPTDSTLKQNIDHFQKRPNQDEYLCSS